MRESQRTLSYSVYTEGLPEPAGRRGAHSWSGKDSAGCRAVAETLVWGGGSCSRSA